MTYDYTIRFCMCLRAIPTIFYSRFISAIVGTSFEGYIIDNLLSQLPSGAEAFFYRTIRGAELDLYIKGLHGKSYAIEIKKSLNQKLSRGFHSACEDLKPDYKYLIHNGEDTFQMADNVIACNVVEFVKRNF